MHSEAAKQLAAFIVSMLRKDKLVSAVDALRYNVAMDIDIVIGANYGDEGKGLTAEFCCRQHSSPIVVLSNGGCQRGHTVDNPERGIRHVFHHFGSGTLLGAPSVYSKTFLVNPIKFIEEKRELVGIGAAPTAFIAPSCVLQLPVDMFVNQSLEKHRGSGKHGSCGWGIWETQVRNASRGHALTFKEFASLDHASKVRTVREETEAHVFNRLVLEGIEPDVETLTALMSTGFIEHFIQDFEEMASSTKCLDSDNLFYIDWGKMCHRDIDAIVVENGQGLLLDKKYAPKDSNRRTDVHSTPSKCGLEGALEALGSDVPVDSVSTFYVSRTYLTRHGNGPFPEESSSIKFKDETNVFNEYQDNIRFGSFTADSIDSLKNRIKTDSQNSKCNVVLTHGNEVDGSKLCSALVESNIYRSFDANSQNIERFNA